jgi:hypothetical protein
MSGFPLPKLLEALAGPNRAVESIVPRRTFQDVILPGVHPALSRPGARQVTSHDLIFNRWGLGQRHPTGLSLAFNFAGPSGTGKTILRRGDCPHARAPADGRQVCRARIDVDGRDAEERRRPSSLARPGTGRSFLR